MLSKDTLAQVEFLRPLLQQFSVGDYGLAVGGAHGKGVADAESDLDFYIFATSVVPNDKRAQMTKELSPDVRDVCSYGNEVSFDQGGTDFYLKGLKIECWLRNSAHIDRAIDECIEGIVKRTLVTWTPTGFYNHCVLSDLNTMIPVDDPDGIIKRWKDKIRVYPVKLRKTIVEQHLSAARFWPHNFHYRSAVERQDVIYCTAIVQQVVHNLIQVLFAVNEVYFPGDKKLAKAISHLQKTPGQVTERIQELLVPSDSMSVNTLRSQQMELQKLLKEVESLAAR